MSTPAPITAQEAITEWLSSLSGYLHSQYDLWVDDDAGTLTVVHLNTGHQLNAAVHDSGIIEYWAALAEPPPIAEVFDALIYVNHDAPPVELVGLVYVGEGWGGGGGGVEGTPIQQ